MRTYDVGRQLTLIMVFINSAVSSHRDDEKRRGTARRAMSFEIFSIAVRKIAFEKTYDR